MRDAGLGGRRTSLQMKTKNCALQTKRVTTCNSLWICALIAATSMGLAEPVITQQPTNQSVSLGANVAFSVSGSGTAPVLYQWRLETMNLASATNSSLALANVQLTNAGNYTVVVTDSSGSVTSKVAALDVDPAFTKIMVGDMVSERG